uniref:Uncharacterized protein n=1 Tax=Spongospora subterranea TaxID=70186 RepID=A0A0H5R478_9EUKA|eukprot:CRZ08647.1 hypothetical protein [Spongospora subterranea]
MTVLAAQANGALLGREYTEWTGEGDGWTPLGEVWKALRERVPDGFENIHAKTEISPDILEGLYQVRFHTANRKNAIKKHKKENFYHKTQTSNYGQMEVSNANRVEVQQHF